MYTHTYAHILNKLEIEFILSSNQVILFWSYIFIFKLYLYNLYLYKFIAENILIAEKEWKIWIMDRKKIIFNSAEDISRKMKESHQFLIQHNIESNGTEINTVPNFICTTAVT